MPCWERFSGWDFKYTTFQLYSHKKKKNKEHITFCLCSRTHVRPNYGHKWNAFFETQNNEEKLSPRFVIKESQAFCCSRLLCHWPLISFCVWLFLKNMMTLKFHIPKMMKLIREGEQLPRRKASLIKRSAAKRKKGRLGRGSPREDREHRTLNSTPTLFSDNSSNTPPPLVPKTRVDLAF